MAFPDCRVLSFHPEIFEHCGSLRVVAVFPHAWHLRARTRETLAVVTSRWNGPLTVRVTALPRVTPGTIATLYETGLEVGGTVFAFARSRPWAVLADQCRVLDSTVLRHDLESMHDRVGAAGRGGLALSMDDIWRSRDEPWGKVQGAPTRGDATSAWLLRGRAEIASLAEALLHQDWDGAAQHAVGLLGLGPGLTPAGDDVVCGLLGGLSVLGRRSSRQRERCEDVLATLTDCVAAQAPRRTTSFSGTLLRSAARGVVTERLLRVLETAGSGTPMSGVDDVLMLGHSSGSDMLTGALLAGAALVRWEELFGPAVVGSR